MTTLTHTAPTPARATFVPTGSGLSFTGIIRSEWIKLWSLRSTPWSFALVVLTALGMAALMSFAMVGLRDSGADIPAGGFPAPDQARTLVTSSTFGVFFGQLIVAVLGVLVMSGEYSTGMIKSTLTAVPRRLPTLWAKTAVLFVATFVVSAVSTIGSFLVSSPILAGTGLHASLFDESVILPLLGGGLYLALVSVFALGIGVILRSSAGGIAAALGMVLLLPSVLPMIPADWVADLGPYLISNAGMNLMGLVGMSTASLGFWQNLLIVLGWVAASLIGAAVLLKRRDA